MCHYFLEESVQKYRMSVNGLVCFLARSANIFQILKFFRSFLVNLFQIILVVNSVHVSGCPIRLLNACEK